MHWQNVALDQPATMQVLGSDALHVWWWPESLLPRQPTRRQRTDAILRSLLSRYMPLDAQSLRFGREAKGRPSTIRVLPTST